MKKTRIKFLALAVALIMSFGIIAACAPAAEEPPPVAGEPAPEAPAPEAPAPAPEAPLPPPPPEPQVNILRFGGQGWDGRFNPIMSANVYDAYVTDLIFESLLTNDAAALPIPLLATWEISEDHLTYTFTLEDGIYFSDGTPLTSADVEFTYRAIGHPDYDGPRTMHVMLLEGFEEFRAGETDEFPGIEVIDDRTIAFHFRDGEASPANIWHFGIGIMPMHIYAFDTWDDFLDMMADPIGSGPFVFEEWRPMEFIRLNRNDNYWNPAGIPLIEAILMLDVPEESLPHAFETGDIDIAQPSTTIDNYNLFNALPTAHSRAIMDNGYQWLAFNTTRPQLQDYRVRQALIYALDRQAYVDIFLGGVLGSVGMAPFTPPSWAFPDDMGALNDYAFNMDRARELMSEAGWEPGADGILERDGVRMELDWLIYPEAPWPGILSGLAADSWAQLGVDLTITSMDFMTVGEITFDAEPGEKEFDVMVMGFSLGMDPDPLDGKFDYGAFVAGGWNVAGYNHPRAQELITLGRATFDQNERIEIYQEFAAIQNEILATVIVAYRDSLWVVSNRVQGMNLDTFWNWTRDAATVTFAG